MRSKKNINKYIYKKKVHVNMYIKFGKKTNGGDSEKCR